MSRMASMTSDFRVPPLHACRYLQQNSIERISHLDACPELDTINLSNNLVKHLDGLACCKKVSVHASNVSPMHLPSMHVVHADWHAFILHSQLTTLICANNQLSTLESVAHLAECPSLTSLDLQNNQLADQAVLNVIKQLPNLKCLYLKGNPLVSTTKNYRKTVISAIPTLGYLDERPVFEDERRLVSAWAIGGLEAEREERKLIKQEQEARDRANFEAMQEIRREGFRRRREALGLPPGETDPALDEISDDEWTPLEDPPELVEARARLAAYTYREGEEEPADLAEARRKLAKEGKAMQAGEWKGSSASGPAENDGEIYLSSVRASQREAVSADRVDQGEAGTGNPLFASPAPAGGTSKRADVADVADMDDARPPADTDKATRATAPVSALEVDLTELD